MQVGCYAATGLRRHLTRPEACADLCKRTFQRFCWGTVKRAPFERKFDQLKLSPRGIDWGGFHGLFWTLKFNSSEKMMFREGVSYQL